MTLSLYFSIFITFFLSWILIKINLSFFYKFFLDIPNERSAHKKEVPNSGGLIIVLVLTLISLIEENPYIYSILPLSIIGFIDDRINLPRISRYIAQCFTTIAIIYNSNFYNYLVTNQNQIIYLLIFLLSILLGTAIINFINFMDGIDGLVAGSAIFILISSSLIIKSLVLFSVISALIAFLLWNWDPAKIFMGDTGSTFIGALLVWLLFNTNNIESSSSILLISLPLIGDAFFCVIRRAINFQNIFNSHSLHLYQRLHKKGLSHGKVSSIYIAATIFLSISYFTIGFKGLILFSLLTIFIGFYLDQKIAKPFITN